MSDHKLTPIYRLSCKTSSAKAEACRIGENQIYIQCPHHNVGEALEFDKSNLGLPLFSVIADIWKNIVHVRPNRDDSGPEGYGPTPTPFDPRTHFSID